MSKYARRVDVNQSELIKVFKQLGCSVFDTSRVAGGFPDLMIGKNKKTVLVEIKSSEKAKYTAAQEHGQTGLQPPTPRHDFPGSAGTQESDVEVNH